MLAASTLTLMPAAPTLTLMPATPTLTLVRAAPRLALPPCLVGFSTGHRNRGTVGVRCHSYALFCAPAYRGVASRFMQGCPTRAATRAHPAAVSWTHRAGRSRA